MAAEEVKPVAVAVLAKAPIPGFAKTRLIPLLGDDGAARLQGRLIERAVATARAGLQDFGLEDFASRQADQRKAGDDQQCGADAAGTQRLL